MLSLDRLLDPIESDERARLADLLERYQGLGATIVNLRFRHRSLEHYLEQVEACAAEIAPSFA